MAQQYPQMQPPPQPPQQRPYSPYPPTASSPVQMSPGGMGMPPANKRPRTGPSPTPPSPYYHTSPYTSMPGTPAQAHTPQPFNQPQPPEQAFDQAQRAPGSMGPPQRPVEKQDKPEKERATDINDLSDVIGASGIDLREEENYLAQTYQNQHQQNSFNNSFSQSPATTSPNNSFNALSQGSFGSYAAFQGAGPVSQPPVSQKSVEDELFEKHKAAARTLAERSQQELNEPFCRANTIRHILGRHTYEQGVKLNLEGLYDKIQDKDKPQGVKGMQAVGPDGTGIVKAQADALLDTNAPLVEILTLLSLATKERLRGIVEDAYALSRSRQLSSHGVVPPDFADIATGHGAPKSTTVVPTSITKTAWDQPDSAVSPLSVPMKRPLDSDTSKNDPSRLPTPPTDTPPTPQPTVSFSSDLTATLRKLQAEERKHEKERIAKRQKRAAKSSEAGSIPGTPGANSSPAEISPAITKMTKKERERIAKAGQTDEVLHKAANTTANMAIGGFGKKYSWLSGGSGSGASTPSRLNTNVGAGAGGGGGGGGSSQDRNLAARDRKWGEWREDGAKGKGIQMRDLVAALEQDGNEKKTLARALVRLKSDN